MVHTWYTHGTYMGTCGQYTVLPSSTSWVVLIDHHLSHDPAIRQRSHDHDLADHLVACDGVAQ